MNSFFDFMAAVPSARPKPIRILPKPTARMELGRPMSSQADISDACADTAPIEKLLKMNAL